ncbi:uncharacterized protein B0H18DRAFT_960575 [Fomitopsis serialis]|uniref:uncharacterized protein n=1 Tax=Fomitopsis serialis TaxID=139415 RepID=UPI002007C09A|nr:uncharacterized protein B0H18DRAFT_960575 [Neoantrodia serialis]KAH9913172.1 hypothetical protein B0H18DRAFT_960575 [Neoantrodia serialis]
MALNFACLLSPSMARAPCRAWQLKVVPFGRCLGPASGRFNFHDSNNSRTEHVHRSIQPLTAVKSQAQNRPLRFAVALGHWPLRFVSIRTVTGIRVVTLTDQPFTSQHNLGPQSGTRTVFALVLPSPDHVTTVSDQKDCKLGALDVQSMRKYRVQHLREWWRWRASNRLGPSGPNQNGLPVAALIRTCESWSVNRFNSCQWSKTKGTIAEDFRPGALNSRHFPYALSASKRRAGMLLDRRVQTATLKEQAAVAESRPPAFT